MNTRSGLSIVGRRYYDYVPTGDGRVYPDVPPEVREAAHAEGERAVLALRRGEKKYRHPATEAMPWGVEREEHYVRMCAVIEHISKWANSSMIERRQKRRRGKRPKRESVKAVVAGPRIEPAECEGFRFSWTTEGRKA